MEEKGIFAFLLRTLITILFWSWILTALTLCGALLGFMINLSINQKEFYPILVYGFTVAGFLIGLYKAESLRKKRALPKHMAALLGTPEIDGKK
jgi:hypothetical protein